MKLLTRLVRAPAALVAAALVLPSLAGAAEPAPPPPAAEQPAAAPQAPALEAPPEVAAAQQALVAAQQTALQDPALKQAMEGLDASLQAEMRKADPEHEAKVKRLGELESELVAAQQQPQPDMTKLAPLLTEAQGLEAQLVATQSQVLQAEPLATRVADFQKQVLAKMTEIDPQVPAHLARLEQRSATR